MSGMADLLLSVTMVVAPTIGYFDQYRIILKNKTSAGFSSVTCAILCFAKFGKRFDITLLFQSIAMLAAILVLLELVIRYKPHYAPFTPLIRHDSISSDESSDEVLQRLELKWYQRRFWDWNHYIDYANCLLLFTSIVGILYLFLHKYTAFVEILGYLSLGIESTLPLPQVLTNYKNGSTDGFSLLILASWFLGDSFKFFYFIYQQSPTQFVVCALIQLSFDTVIVFQFILTFVKKRMGGSPILLQEDQPDEILV